LQPQSPIKDVETSVPRRFQILALDGGGIKGIFSAAVLAALEDDLNTTITKHFDLIVGTSTGGIIALALAIGKQPKEIVDFYGKIGSEVFSNPFRLRSFGRLLKSKYPLERLEQAIKEVLGENETLGTVKKRLVIPSYNLGEDDVYLFKTPHHQRLTRDWKVPLWKVALATSAAPTYFPASKHIDHIRHIDGGIWANNPSLVGVLEAISMLGVAAQDIHVFNIGTTTPNTPRPDFLDWGGLFAWAGQAPDVLMRAQSKAVVAHLQHLLPRENVIRFDAIVPQGSFKLDKAKPEKLLAMATHESRKFCPTFKAKFLEHIAPEYQPFHLLQEA
jgi:uncharacterized protein